MGSRGRSKREGVGWEQGEGVLWAGYVWSHTCSGGHAHTGELWGWAGLGFKESSGTIEKGWLGQIKERGKQRV